MGGLGLGELKNKNRALLTKWWWRFGEEREAIWRKVIEFTYGEDRWGWVPGVSLDIRCRVFGFC